MSPSRRRGRRVHMLNQNARTRRRHGGVRHGFSGRIGEGHFNNAFCELVFRQLEVVRQQLRHNVRNCRQKLLARIRFQGQAGNVGARANKSPALGASHYGNLKALFSQNQASPRNCINRCISNLTLDFAPNRRASDISNFAGSSSDSIRLRDSYWASHV